MDAGYVLARLLPGILRLGLESRLSWANTAVWTGTIRVGGGCDSSSPSAVYSPPDAQTLGALISSVTAMYEPAD